MKYYAVTGNPVSHSLSPEIFNSFFMENDIDSLYKKLSAADSESAMEFFKFFPLHGLNITSPFKSLIINNFDRETIVGGNVLKCASVNLLRKMGENIHAYNTDYEGVIETIKNNNIDLCGMKSAVFGGGPAGRVASKALVDLKSDVTLFSTEPWSLKDFGDSEYIKIKPYEDLLNDRNYEFVINTLPPNVDVEFIKEIECKYVFNANYHGTSLKNILPDDVKYIDGIQWLINQAAPSIKLLTGRETEFSKLRSYLEGVRPDKLSRIALIGFMGSGKTTVGSLLADKLCYEFCDTDEIIEEECDKKISEIFAVEGEVAFRKKETEVLSNLLRKEKIVTACGGGVVETRKGRDLLAEFDFVIYLYSSFNECYSKICIDPGRPLISRLSLAELLLLYERRKPEYFKASGLITTGNETPDETADRLFREIKYLQL